MPTLTQAAVDILTTPAGKDKAALSAATAKAWRDGQIADIGSMAPPKRPARPATPVLLPPRDMPRRRGSGVSKRIAFVHAIAHIELNAIDLAWDIIARFADPTLPRTFYDDWVTVAEEEARHFSLLSRLLTDLGGTYGDLPAHDGLWEAAENTADDILARLAIVPMVLEARGLDTTPHAIARLRRDGDDQTADVLEVIEADEVDHVAAGVKWFEFLCEHRQLNAVDTFQDFVRTRFNGNLKPPFATDARMKAGMAHAYYAPWDT